MGRWIIHVDAMVLLEIVELKKMLDNLQVQDNQILFHITVMF